MAFDLVHYFYEQALIQKPELLSNLTIDEKKFHLNELNSLALGKIIQLWRFDENTLYQKIHQIDSIELRRLAHQLSTSAQNKSELDQISQENTLTGILALQLGELAQLDNTANLGKEGIGELLNGQLEYLSGQVNDWVWQTNQLKELVGTKQNVDNHTSEISLDESMKDFKDMIHQHNEKVISLNDVSETHSIITPQWAKIIAPIVAFFIILFLYFQYIKLIS